MPAGWTRAASNTQKARGVATRKLKCFDRHIGAESDAVFIAYFVNRVIPHGDLLHRFECFFQASP